MSAPTPPTVLLSPRSPWRLPQAEIDIPPPPGVPSKPSGSLLLQLLPVGLAAVGMGVILLVGTAQSGGLLLVLVFGTLLMVGSGGIVAWLSHRGQSAEYRRLTRERVERYLDMLVRTRDRALGYLKEQHALLLDKDPDPATCVQFAVERSPRLWERSPGDADFLDLRIGIGARPSCVPVRAPRQPDPLLPDPLVETAEGLAAWAGSVWDVPIVVRLHDGGALGVCGDRTSVLDAMRALLVQLATHHAPDEIKLVAVVPPAEAEHWGWLRWLPHTWSDDRRERFLASTPAEASRLSKRLEEILGRRRDTTSFFGASSALPRMHVPHYVVLVADEALADSMPVLATLTDGSAPVGASVVYVSSHRTRLPRSCRTVLDVASGLITHADATVEHVLAVDSASSEQVEQLARTLAPLRAKRIAAATGLPAQVALLDVLGAQSVDQLDVLQRWDHARPEHSLAVPIGVRPGGDPLYLDLHQTADGPHGLLAGSTGSGKSALTQTLLLGLATTFHPHDLVIVLVDYKGGSTAGPLQQLPHLVGTITNLDGNLARRALVALQAEIERRQAALAALGCDDLDTYLARRRRGEPLEPLPHLVLVVDEFAELKSERPDFIHQLVRTARVGRNVGVHLILATQKPRPAVDEEIWANARFRICLRVEQPQDSHDVLKRPDAASLVGRGQGYLQVGHDELFTLFQSAWGGSPYRAESAASNPRDVVLVGLDGTRRAIDAARSRDVETGRGMTQAEALASHLREAAEHAGIHRLPPVWLAPLRDRIVLDELLDATAGWDGQGWRPTLRWVEPVLGAIDAPARRSQAPLRVDLASAGNLVIYGAPGSGKTTALLTLARSLAVEHSPADVQMYLLDFGGQSLRGLREAPHVGGVVVLDEEEKLIRVLRWLGAELSRRKSLFGEAGVATLPAYRAATRRDLPAIVVAIDNLPGLLHAYPDIEDEVAQIAQQGGSLGVHTVITASSPALVRLRIANSFTQVLTLRLADRSDYSAVLSLPEGYEAPPQSGRGLIKGRPTLECQVALPAPGETEADQSAFVRQLAHDMHAAWCGARPWQVRTLPEHVYLADLVPAQPRKDGLPIAPIGLAVDDLSPLEVDLRDGPHFLISGPPRGGKSTLLRTWLASLRASVPSDRLRLCLADFNSDEPLAGVCQLRDDADLTALLDEVEAIPTVLGIDDLEGLQRSVSSETLNRVNEVVRARGQRGLYVILVGSTGSFGASYDGIGHTLKTLQTGFLVGGSDYDDIQVLGINVPRSEASLGVPPGRGFYSRRKHWLRIKVAEPRLSAP